MHITFKQSSITQKIKYFSNERSSEILMCIMIFLLSFLLLYAVSGFVPNLFLIDDNINQWQPVINKAFDYLLANGKIPYIDFYQMKGMEIFDVGYYSLCNPIMFLSYLISRYSLSSLNLNTIPVYIYIMFSLGNMICYCLARKMMLIKRYSFLVTMMYSGCSSFFHFGYWYYVFGNYVIIPLMLLVLLVFKDRKHFYYASGIVLAFSLLLGNIQYTVYQYIAFCIIMFFMGICYQRKYFLSMITNCLIGISLTFPQLLLLIEASKRSFVFSRSNDFFALSTIPIKTLFYLIFPYWMIEPITSEINGFFNRISGNINETYHQYDFVYSGGLGICLICFFIFLIFQRKSFLINDLADKNKFLKSLTLSVFIACGFFIFFCFGTSGIIALIIYQLPIVKNFRYLMKAMLIAQPLMLLPAIYLLLTTHKRQRLLLIIILMLSVIFSFYNDYQIIHKGIYTNFIKNIYDNNVQINNAAINKELKELKIDKDNYRIVSFLDKNFSANDKISYWSDYIKDAFSIYKKLLRNNGTELNTFSLSGYDTTANIRGYYQSNLILTNLIFSYEYANGICSDEMLSKLENNDRLLKEFLLQVNNNAVKYFIFTKNSVFIPRFISLINKIPQLSINRIVPFIDNTDIIELNGVDSLCKTVEGSDIQLKSEIGKLSFQKTNKENNIFLSFTYNDKYKATYVGKDGKLVQLPIRPNEQGYLIVTAKGSGNGKIIVVYDYYLCDIAVAFSILSIGLMTVLTSFMCYALKS